MLTVWVCSFGAQPGRHEAHAATFGIAQSCDPGKQSCAPGTTLISPGPASCGAGIGGATVCGNGLATLGNQSGTNQGGGNPINIINGNKYQREDDLPALPGVLGLEIVRHYNSAYSTPDTTIGILGRGWKLSYETDLYVIGETVQIIQADGTRIIFNRDPANRSLCSTADPAHGRLRIESGRRGDTYLWTWTNGRELRFDSAGKLVQIAAPSGEFVSLLRDPAGLLLQVTDPQGRQLRLQYPARGETSRNQFRGVASIASPVGVFAYRYGSVEQGAAATSARAPTDKTAPAKVASTVANLVAVTYPDQRGSRLYHYEDARRPSFLSGISGVGDIGGKSDLRRLSTYLYDVNGRAILSVRGAPARLQTDAHGAPLQPARLVDGTGVGQVHLDFATPGLTVLTNSLNQQTFYRRAIVAGQYRLLEVRGAGCNQCGEVDVRYGYDKLGRLTERTRIDEAGAPIASVVTQRDAIGRPVTISRVAYTAGQPGAPQVQVRFAYPSGSTADAPSMVSRPSVMPGKQHELRIEYNDRAQPVRVTETGFVPVVSDTPAAVELDPTQALATTRVTTYRYQAINGRSVLAEIDGPLKNGPANRPADSDITRIDWSRDGALIETIVQPGNRTTHLEYGKEGAEGAEGARRLLKTTGPDGVVTQLQYDFSGTLTELRRGGLITRFQRQGSQADTDILTPDGQTMRIEFSALHEVTSITDHQHNRIALQRDTEGTLMGASLLETGGTPTQDALHFRGQPGGSRPRDAVLAGIEQIIASTGNADGAAATGVDAIVMPNRIVQNFIAAATAAIDAEPRRAVKQVPDTSGKMTTYVTDDFGNLIAMRSPTTGLTTYRYDADGRILGRRQQDGSHVDYQRDVAGRVIALRATSATNTLDENASIAWGRAGKPVRITYLAGDEKFDYDAANRLIAHEQTVDGQRYLLRYRYDSAGRLSGKTLPDGQTLRYRYRDGSHPRAGLLESVWLEGFANDTASTVTRGLLDRPIVTGMNDAADRYAHRTSRFGNGLPNALQLDRQGRIISAGNAEVGQTQLQYGDTPIGLVPTYPSSVRTVHNMQPGQRALSFEDATIAQALRSRVHRISADWRAGAPDPESASPVNAFSPPGSPVATFDQRGRQISLGASRFTYDSLNRLTGIDRTTDGRNEPVARYRYNLFGQRIAKTVALTHGSTTRTTHYFYDGSQLAFEGSASGQAADAAPGTRTVSTGALQSVANKGDAPESSQYVWINEKPVALLRGGQLYAVHTDHRNAPLALTDAARQVVWQASVADYLQATPASGASFGAIAFDLRGSNQYFDRESGLHYNTARYYDPVSTRYLTPDPLGLAVGPDLHAFALNRPQTMADPLGLAPVAAIKDWSNASYEDKFVEIVKRAAPMVPGEIGAALLEMVQPGNLAAMGAVFTVWAAAQGTPAGWITDALLLGLSYYALGSGVIDLIEGVMALHNGATKAKCDPDLTAAAQIVAKRLVTAAGGISGGGLGAAAITKSGGIARIENGLRDIYCLC